MSRDNKEWALGAKFIDTFMHQMMKYPDFKQLYHSLYLPLDRAIIPPLRKSFSEFLGSDFDKRINALLKPETIYQTTEENYYAIQDELRILAAEIGKKIGRPNMARIELNVLWAIGKK